MNENEATSQRKYWVLLTLLAIFGPFLVETVLKHIKKEGCMVKIRVFCVSLPVMVFSPWQIMFEQKGSVGA